MALQQEIEVITLIQEHDPSTEPAGAPRPQRAPDDDAPVTVYVVDDDPAVSESVRWLLESIHISPIICHDADELLEIYDGETPACLVLDVRMPRMSGTRLQRVLNELAPHASVIFMSAHGDIRLSVSTLQAGAQDFLEKPYEPQRLLDAVQRGIDSAFQNFQSHVERRDIINKIKTLTPREREILELVIEGVPSQQIARRLDLSVKTVDVHRARIKNKTDTEAIPVLMRDVLRSGVDLGEID